MLSDSCAPRTDITTATDKLPFSESSDCRKREQEYCVFAVCMVREQDIEGSNPSGPKQRQTFRYMVVLFI